MGTSYLIYLIIYKTRIKKAIELNWKKVNRKNRILQEKFINIIYHELKWFQDLLHSHNARSQSQADMSGSKFKDSAKIVTTRANFCNLFFQFQTFFKMSENYNTV